MCCTIRGSGEVPTPMMSSCPATRPSKRIRADAESSPAKVKDESSPSPPPERRLVTCGTKRYTPLPSDCLSSCPGFRQNRSNWVARCVKELEALSLIPERKLIRSVLREQSFSPVINLSQGRRLDHRLVSHVRLLRPFTNLPQEKPRPRLVRYPQA